MINNNLTFYIHHQKKIKLLKKELNYLTNLFAIKKISKE